MKQMDLQKSEALLHSLECSLNDQADSVLALVTNPHFTDLSHRHSDCVEKRNVYLGLNIFTMVSELYHRENFHSDILKALLDPSNSPAGSKYLELFLDLLNVRGAKIRSSHYTDVIIEREKGRIDITIKDRRSKRAIIIENKIKNAHDQPRQIPNYLNRVNQDGYTCDAIVYLRLNEYKEPFKLDWTPEEVTEVGRLLVVLIAYEESADDLLNGWIHKCEAISVNFETSFVFKQYAALLTALGRNVMNKPIMQKFYTKMLEGENFQTAETLRLMLEDLVAFRRDKIIELFQSDHAPFDKRPWKYQNSAIFETLAWKDAELGVDVEAESNRYVFYFWDRAHIKKRPSEDWAKDVLRQLGYLEEFTLEDDGKRRMYSKIFLFPSQEQELYTYLQLFKNKLKRLR